MTIERRSPESTSVQLTRMEGKLDRVVDRVDDLRDRVDLHDTSIDTLKSQTQSLADGATASKDTAVALALALKDAKETAEATARSEAAKATAITKESETRAALGWSPVTRLFAVLAAIAIMYNLYQTVSGR